MERVESVLVAVDRNQSARAALEKGAMLARQFGARVELFLCDAERAFALKREYDARGVEEARASCLAEATGFLEKLRESTSAGEQSITIDAACESPLYEGIVHKVQRSRPDLLVRSIGSESSRQLAGLSETDWSLARTCPAPLMLTHGRPWGRPPRVAAAVDVSGVDEPELTRTILRAAAFVSKKCGGAFEVIHVHGEPDSSLEAMESCKAALVSQIEEAGVRPDQIHALAGEPTSMLPEFAASRGYDVFVMGALTHGQAPTALVGTLTSRLLGALRCDFLLVKPLIFVSPIAGGRDS